MDLKKTKIKMRVCRERVGMVSGVVKSRGATKLVVTSNKQFSLHKIFMMNSVKRWAYPMALS